MVLETTKENVSINQLISEKKEMIFVQGDMIVPDAKPDILNTIHTSGNICVYKKEIMDEKVRFDGNINTYIMYMADNSEDTVRGLNTNLDFTETINVPNCKADMLLESQMEIKSIECKILNGRKINVKVGLEVKIRVFANENISMVHEMKEQKDIQILKKEIELNSLVGSGNTKVYVKDTVRIDNVDQLAEILKAKIDLVDKDIKVSYNKVLAKAEAEIKLMYLTEDNQIRSISNKIPVVGFIDIQEVSEDNICDTNYEIKNMVIKPNNVEDHSIYIELEIEILCMAYETKTINLMQDLYSPSEEIIFQQRQICTIKGKQHRKNICQIREKVNISELANNLLLDVEANSCITNENKLNNKMVYEGELQINFMILNKENNQINTKTSKIPFESIIEDIECKEESHITTTLEINTQDFILLDNGEVNCNVDLVFYLDCYQNEIISVMEDIEQEENREVQDYSVVVYIVKPGDTLWNIAKKYKSTIDDIVRVNGIENPDKIEIGLHLYIPKYVAKRNSISEDSQLQINYA